MFEIIQERNRIRFRVSSTRDNIAQVLEEVRGLLRFGETKDLACLQLILRELLANAYHHGNNEQGNRIILCELLDVGKPRMIVRVMDEGSGFAFNALQLSSAPEADRGRLRGLPLVQALAEELNFTGNGNTAVVLLSWIGPPPQILSTPHPLPLNHTILQMSCKERAVAPSNLIP